MGLVLEATRKKQVTRERRRLRSRISDLTGDAGEVLATQAEKQDLGFSARGGCEEAAARKK